jgi:transcriptional regulator with XRE-family HTH domain
MDATMRHAHRTVNGVMHYRHCRDIGPLPTMNPMEIGRAIEHFRKLAGITQLELAARVDIHQSNLSRIINGKQDIGFALLSRICKELGVPASDVVAFAENGDNEAVRWANLYAHLPPEDRAAVFRLLEQKAEYRPKV